jgi:hypothetical protein
VRPRRSMGVLYICPVCLKVPKFLFRTKQKRFDNIFQRKNKALPAKKSIDLSQIKMATLLKVVIFI